MTATLHRERISAQGALAATLLYRICALWLPLAVALAVQAGRRSRPAAPRSFRRRGR
jgi:uncharacterized membrane protein YbhN (UPF0104 family)